MVTKVGIVGASPGNGHPFSFSAIINGYDKKAFEQTEWDVILNYLEAKKEHVGIPELEVTHAWTQHPELTEKLCQACKIETPVKKPEDFCGKVQAVIIARDDAASHSKLARPFLEAGLPVFIDKPLSLKQEDLKFFEPYLKKGQLMSTSGLRFSNEIKNIKSKLPELGELLCIDGVVLNDFLKYGIHLLDAVSSLKLGKIIRITKLRGKVESFSFLLSSGILFNLHCLGNRSSKIFRLNFYGEKKTESCEISDNFSAFKNMLLEFSNFIQTRSCSFDVCEVLETMSILNAGHGLQPGESVKLR